MIKILIKKVLPIIIRVLVYTWKILKPLMFCLVYGPDCSCRAPSYNNLVFPPSLDYILSRFFHLSYVFLILHCHCHIYIIPILLGHCLIYGRCSYQSMWYMTLILPSHCIIWFWFFLVCLLYIVLILTVTKVYMCRPYALIIDETGKIKIILKWYGTTFTSSTF